MGRALRATVLAAAFLAGAVAVLTVMAAGIILMAVTP